MKNRFALVLLLLSHLTMAQNRSVFRYEEDSIRAIHQGMLGDESDSLKQVWNVQLKNKLKLVLQAPASADFPFDSLVSIAVFAPEDKSFRLFNWEYTLSDGSVRYEACVQFYSKKKKALDLIFLKDASAELKRPENQNLDAQNWLGAHYYKLIETRYKKKRYYTLLGANRSNPLLRRKVIEVIVIGNDGKLKFGAPLFESGKIVNRRVVFQYSAEVSMSLRYDDQKQQILFDHLVPRSPDLKGQFEFYGPDMSIDAFEFKKGKWRLIEDVDARNQKRN